MSASRVFLTPAGLLLLCGPLAAAQLPATPPTAPLTAVATAADHPGERPHPAQVTCASGQLAIQAENSSLNGILRAIARCTGMTISGGVAEQRVFGNYGPAAPATVLATLLDGTGSNMLLLETAADQPARLILTPRTAGGVTPPAPSTYADSDVSTSSQPSAQPSTERPLQPFVNRPGLHPLPASSDFRPGSQTPTLPPLTGSAVSTPGSIPQPINNVTGSPSNTSPTASDYRSPDPGSVDSVATPSTAPTPNGLVDAPNPPPAGSDTAKANDSTAPTPTTNTTLPANPGQISTDLTPEQVYQQLRQRELQQQQQQQQTTTTPQ